MGSTPCPGDDAMPRSHILDLRWIALLNDFRRSGLTHAEFCRRRGISIHSFRKHLYLARPPRSQPAHQPAADGIVAAFLPVTVLPDTPTAPAASPPPLELILPSGRRIAVAPGFDPQTLRRLIAVAEDPTCSD
jgi:transposase